MTLDALTSHPVSALVAWQLGAPAAALAAIGLPALVGRPLSERATTRVVAFAFFSCFVAALAVLVALATSGFTGAGRASRQALRRWSSHGEHRSRRRRPVDSLRLLLDRTVQPRQRVRRQIPPSRAGVHAVLHPAGVVRHRHEPDGSFRQHRRVVRRLGVSRDLLRPAHRLLPRTGATPSMPPSGPSSPTGSATSASSEPAS